MNCMRYASNDVERLKLFRTILIGDSIVKDCSEVISVDDVFIIHINKVKNSTKLQKLLKKFNKIIFSL